MPAAAEQLVDRYRDFLDLSRQILAAARSADWDALIRTDGVRTELLATIKQMDATVGLEPPALERKLSLIEESLALEAETRNLVERWMADLRSSIHSNRQEQLLLKSYGSMASPQDSGAE